MSVIPYGGPTTIALTACEFITRFKAHAEFRGLEGEDVTGLVTNAAAFVHLADTEKPVSDLCTFGSSPNPSANIRFVFSVGLRSPLSNRPI